MDLKENKLIIFRNKKKASDKHPDWRGEIDVKGERFEISLWESTVKSGETYFSGSIQPPYQKAEPPAGIYEKTGKLEKPIDKEQIQDDTPIDSDGLPF